MTRKIEETLDLPSLEEALKGVSSPEEIEVINQELDEIANALEDSYESEMLMADPVGVHEHSKEMDDIYSNAMKAHKDLLDLGFNMEAKNAGSIMEPAARMLEIAMKASQNKVDTKMKSIKLRMDREKLDADLKKNELEGEIEGSPREGGYVADRNELLKKLKDKKA